jgi:drug/metabolite transporter (DMT)-like permease
MRVMSPLRGRTLAVYLFLCAVWGSTWMVIKIGLEYLPPLFFAAVRMAIACLVLVPLAFRSGAAWPTRREWRFVALSGLFQIAAFYALIFLAEQWIDSGLAALLFAIFPICAAVFAHFLLPNEPITPTTLAAAALGLAGVALIQAPALARAAGAQSTALFRGGALVFAAAIVAAWSNVLVKKHLGGVDPARNVWGQTLVATVVLFAASSAFERGSAAHWTPPAWVSVLYLAIIGTAATFVGLFWLMKRVTVFLVATIPLVDTLIAVVLGNLVLHERFSPRILFGGALILTGVVLAARGSRTEAAAGA